MLTQLSASSFSTGVASGAQNAGEAAAGFLAERLHDRGEQFVFRPDQPIDRSGTQARRGGDVADRGDLVAFSAELGSCHRADMCGFVVAVGLALVGPGLDRRLGGGESSWSCSIPDRWAADWPDRAT